MVEDGKSSIIYPLAFLEVVPALCVLIFVIFMLSFLPTLEPVQHAVRQDIDMESLENVLNNTRLGKP